MKRPNLFILAILLALSLQLVWICPAPGLAVPMAAAASPSSAPAILWDKTFGGPADDVGYSIIEDGGGYVVVGSKGDSSGNNDALLLKTNKKGEEQWEQIFVASATYGGQALAEVKGGGYVIGGGKFTGSLMNWDDAWLIKTDVGGNSLWDETYDTSNGYVKAVKQTKDKGFIMLIAHDIPNPHYFVLMKTDSAGNQQWERFFTGTGPSYAGNSIIQTADGSYVFVGATSYLESDSMFRPWLIKTDSAGNIIWNVKLDAVADGITCSFAPTSDGGYIVIQSGFPSPGVISLIKTDSSGNMLWENTFPGFGESVAQTQDGGYVVTGRTQLLGWELNSDVLVIRTDSLGNKLWDMTMGGSEDDAGYAVIQTSGKGFAIVGSTESYGAGGSDVWLIKLDKEAKK